MIIFKQILMSANKPIIGTFLFTSIPFILQNITPIFASATAIIGTVYIFFKCWNEINKWKKERKNDS